MPNPILSRVVARGKPSDWDKIAPAPYALTVRNQDAAEHNTAWQVHAQAYLQRLGAAEYATAIHAHKKARKSTKPYRHTPSEYMRALCMLLGQNDEHGFKALKMLEGYASAIGVQITPVQIS